MLQQDTTANSESEYLELCQQLFSGWARTVRTRPNAARTYRGYLKNLHQLFAEQQACPAYYAELIRAQLIRAHL